MVLPFFVSCAGKINEDCDLLKSYGATHGYLEFIDCHTGDGQIIKYSNYKVTGTNSLEVENFLVENYGMGKLMFTCCGWEPEEGKEGEIIITELKKLNKDYHLLVSMYGNAEKTNEKDSAYIEKDRNKIDYFYVIVRLLEI